MRKGMKVRRKREKTREYWRKKEENEAQEET